MKTTLLPSGVPMRCFNIPLVLLSILLFVWSRPIPADPGDLLQTIVNPAPGENARFGVSVALGDGQILVGVPQDDTGATEAGVVYLFGTDGTLLQTFQNPTPDAFDRFGTSVALGEDYVLVGAIKDDAGGYLSGTAYLFDTDGNLLQTFPHPNPHADDRFGSSVALTVDRVLVGAVSDRTEATASGAAYLFDMAGNLLHTFLNPSPDAFDNFGFKVALVDGYVLVGAPRDDTGATDAGAVYLFDTAGNLLQTLQKPIPDAADLFGYSVALTDNHVLVGAAGDDTGAPVSGAVYLFDMAGNLEHTFLNPTPWLSDQFGWSVALAGDQILVSAISDDTGAVNAGAAYLFDTGGTLLQTFLNPAPVPGVTDQFGYSVGLVDGQILVGAPKDDTGATDAGAAHLFEGIATFTVDSVLDTGDSNPGDGVCDDGGGNCTLRAAIEEANALAGADRIHFDIPGGGPHTFIPGSPLPTITDPVTIDGTTEPDFAGTPIIELDGSSAGADVTGLTINAGSSVVKGLVINRFTYYGILLQTNGGNILEGNYIGTDVTGTAALGNGADGVRILQVPNCTIGGTTVGVRNLISGNNSGIYIVGSSATGNVVQGNYIGTDVTGAVDLGNAGNGVIIHGGVSNAIGGTVEGAGNLISGNNSGGVLIYTSWATENVVEGNYIGTDVTGAVDLGNDGHGVAISSAPNNRIGGAAPGAGNLISGNYGQGVYISNETAGNLVQGNYIGTDVTGAAGLGNSQDGVRCNGLDNTIGGTVAGEGNIISGNDGKGIWLLGNGNVVAGNYIGTDVTGAAGLGNAGSGVTIWSGSNTVGGTTGAARNIISDNGGGIVISYGAMSNQILGNYIGTDVTGAAGLGNAGSGVILQVGASDNTIGGTVSGAGNLISANTGPGIVIARDQTGIVVQGNYIGTDVTGTADLGNGQDGVLIDRASGNTVGGMVEGAGNVIAHNGWDGVHVKYSETGIGNAILSNAIHANGDLGIDLDTDGVNGNDTGDGDTGANNLQNFPILSEAFSGTNMVSGTLNSTPSTGFRLEFFVNDIADATGFGEGQVFLGATDVTTDGNGDASFSAHVPTSFALGQFIAATATDPNNNTSEFSQSIEVVESTISVSLPDTVSPYGQALKVPVRVSDTSGKGIVSAEVFVSYDGDLLTAFSTSTTGTLLTDDWSVETNIVEGNGTNVDTVKIAMATGEDPLAGAGTLININFTVGDIRSPASSALTLEHVLFNDGTPPNTTSDGSVTLVGIDGTIENDPTQIIPREDVTVTVADADEDRNSGTQDSFDVRVSNGAQSETLTVLESTVNSGIFEGMINTVFSLGSTSEDGIVQAQAGDLIQCCYDDSLDVDGNTIERCADADVIGGTDGAIRVTIVSQPGDTVRVRVTDADLNTHAGIQETTTVEAANPTSGEAETITLTELDGDNPVFFGIVATAISSGSTSDGVIATQKGEEVVVTYADTLLANGGTVDLADTDYVADPFGDADGNGSVQAFDAAKVLLHCLVPYLTGLDSLSANLDLLAFHPEAPGANPPPPGQITPYDASLILQKRVGLIGRFEVQEDEADNHPQPETDASTPKGLADERRIALQLGDGYLSVWVEDRSSIVSGELLMEGVEGSVEMGEELSDFLSASRQMEDGLRVVFAGAIPADGPGELLRVFGVGPEEARLTRARFNGGNIIGRMGEVEESGVVPARFALYPNVPNPFNPETVIRFALARESQVRLEVFDVVGQRVRTLVGEQLPSGMHQAVWDGRGENGALVSSGVYFYRLQALHEGGEFSQVRRMLLIK